ncbi:autotransporter adhesin [Burkholderia ambifaria]|nr:YadA-like family protein [Burkholderia ambifaria]MDR6503945.1 autotransporter adhesin [Burkholderia ambifaria]
MLSTSTSTGLSSLSTGIGNVTGAVMSLSTGQIDLDNQIISLSTTIINNATLASNTRGISADMKGDGSDKPSVTPGSNSIAIGANSTDGGRSNVVSVGNSTQQRQITNVAAGTQPADAVNVQQFNSGLASAINQANNYTNSQIHGLQNSLESTRKDADGGAAAAMAVAGLPQPSSPGMNMVAIAGSVYRGQSGQALGITRISENGHWIYKGAVTSSTRGSYGVVLGGGYQW